jgi:hypothetical protein
LERKGRGIIEVLSQHLPGGTMDNHETLSQDAGMSVVIRTEHVKSVFEFWPSPQSRNTLLLGVWQSQFSELTSKLFLETTAKYLIGIRGESTQYTVAMQLNCVD